MKDKIKKLLNAEAEAIKNIPISDAYEKAINLLYETIHINHGKLIASGMGKAGQIANNIATTFSSTGTQAIFLHPSDAQHGDIGVIQQRFKGFFLCCEIVIISSPHFGRTDYSNILVCQMSDIDCLQTLNDVC